MANSATIIDSGSELSRIKDQLEALIDRISIDSTLEMIETICEDKAEHIAVNWQDQRLASKWLRVAHSLNRTARLAINL